MLGISQSPLFGQAAGGADQGTGAAASTGLPTRSPIEDRYRRLRERFTGLVELETTRLELGHTHYADLVRPAAAPGTLVVVVPLTSPLLDEPRWIDVLAPSVTLLISAPRHDARDTARVADSLPSAPPTAARVYLERGPTSSWHLAVPGAVAPLWLTRTIMAASPVPVLRAELNAARLGFGREDAQLREALENDQAAARLTVADAADITRALAELPGRLAGLASTERREARNYLVVPLQRDLIIPESVLVWSIVAIAGLVLSYTVARPRRIYRYVRAIGHNLGATVGLFAVLVVSQIVANLVIRLLFRVPLIDPSPLVLAAGKLSIGVLVLALLYPLLHIRLRRASAVYSGTSLFLMVVGALVAGSSSIILGAFFVVTFVSGFVFSMVRPAVLKAAALLAALAPGIYLLLALASVADARIAAELLTPPIARELVTAVIFLPLLLMFFRLEAITPRVPLLTIMVMVSLISLALVAATVIVGASDPPPLAVHVEERVAAAPGSARVELTPDREVPATVAQQAVRLYAPGNRELACVELPCRGTLPAREGTFTMNLSQDLALDRYSIQIDIRFSEAAEDLELIVESSLPVQLYASDLPMEQAVGTTGSRFVTILGPRPPGAVSGTLVLRRDPAAPAGPVSLQISARAGYDRTADARLEAREAAGLFAAGGVELAGYRELQVTTAALTLGSVPAGSPDETQEP